MQLCSPFLSPKHPSGTYPNATNNNDNGRNQLSYPANQEGAKTPLNWGLGVNPGLDVQQHVKKKKEDPRRESLHNANKKTTKVSMASEALVPEKFLKMKLRFQNPMQKMIRPHREASKTNGFEVLK